MQAENQRTNVFVLPHCLGERDGDATLYVTANPYASSLLTPSADYAKYYCEVMLSGELDRVDVQGAYYDALYAKENEVVGTQPVRMRSLDSLAAEGALPLGRLPGDIYIHCGNTTFYFPIVTCVLVSAVLTLVLWIFNRR